MKNIHVLPTDKPSRLIINWENDLCYKSKPYLMEGTQNIYITSDEEIKEGDWVYHYASHKMFKYDGHGLCVEVEKIILTTDQDLIKDGVQAIDDDFLEWFVKNPGCEEVEVFKDERLEEEQDFHFYEIIIPKEEPKQEDKIKEVVNYFKTHKPNNWEQEESIRQIFIDETKEKLWAEGKGDAGFSEEYVFWLEQKLIEKYLL
jgi:hypothetical protein